jgi:hypothetical protein
MNCILVRRQRRTCQNLGVLLLLPGWPQGL